MIVRPKESIQTTGHGNGASEEKVVVPHGLMDFQRQFSLKAGALQDAIFNSANFSSIATDEKGVIQIFNVGAERMLGYAAIEVVNRITPADMSDAQELIARAAELSLELATKIAPGFEALVFKASRGIKDNYELTYIRKDGSRLPAVVSVTALRDADNKIIGYLLIVTDNTARKLEEKNIELEHASRMKTEFLATMSHELRTPLNAIIGFSEALKDGLVGDLSPMQHEYIGDIFSSGQHLLSLINDILDLSKVEAGMMTLDLEAVDFNSMLLNSLSIVREKAAVQHINLELEAGEDLGLPQLDMRKTKQIVYNLLSNAVKFSINGGRVTLRARCVSRSTVGTFVGDRPVYGFPLADSDYNDFLEISVTDDGIGIPRESMPKLFHAFSQIDSSLARKFEGTGLGLAMVKQLAELHGGTVAVASVEGEGSCFAAWLPLRNSAHADAIVHVDLGPNPLSSTKPAESTALVVTDDERLADLVSVLLEEEGFSVLRAASVAAALVLAAKELPSLITLDLDMPGIDEGAFMQRIREDRALAHIPVVTVAGATGSHMAVPGGASAVLQKPISRMQLKAALGQLGLHAATEHTHTILVVDDDPNAVQVIATFLPSPAYAVVRAYGGREAITLARQIRPDLILLDLMMPEVNGFDVIEALRHDNDTTRIPIMVVTAKPITALDRGALDSDPARRITIIEKMAFNRTRFIAEVRRALLPLKRETPDGQSTRH